MPTYLYKSRDATGKAVSGEAISGLDIAEAMLGVQVFHAGTALEDDRLVTAGGRVLNVCAVGEDMADALSRAYQAADEIHWPGKVVRQDIGRRVLEGLRERA